MQISDFRFRKDILLKDIFFSQTKEILKLISLLLTNNSLLVKECLKRKYKIYFSLELSRKDRLLTNLYLVEVIAS